MSDASYETHSENAVAHALCAPVDEVARSAVHNAATNPTPPPAERYGSINKPSSELVIVATASSVQKNYRREDAFDAEKGGEAEEKSSSEKWWMIVMRFVCGIEGMESEAKPEATGAADTAAAQAANMQKARKQTRLEQMRECLGSVTESDGMCRVATANAIALLTIGVFIWAFLM